MVIVLDTPFSVGELSEDKFPHVYASKVTVDGRLQTVLIQYEYGSMASDGTWTPTPVPTGGAYTLMGDTLAPFFFTRPSTMDAALWDQAETIIYKQLQKLSPRMTGAIKEVVAYPDLGTEADTPAASASTPANSSAPKSVHQMVLPFRINGDLLSQMPVSFLAEA